MNFPLFIARRYFLSKRKKNFINIISILSMGGIAFSTAALIIVLSVFNGLGELIRSLDTSFDPQIKIEATKGKSFAVDSVFLSKIKSIDGVSIVTEVIEDYAYVRYRDADMVAIIRGVGDSFLDQKRLDDHMVEGELAFKKNDVPFAILGSGVQETLSVSVEDDMYAMQIFYIKNSKSNSLDPSNMYSRMSIRPGGVFSIEQTINDNYIFLPLEFTRDLLNYGDRRTYLEVQLNPSFEATQVQAKLKEMLGDTFQVLTNEELHKDVYRLLKMEKLFTFLALSLLILVGSINIFFSLMMLAIDKKKDISVLIAMGATGDLVKRIFLSEGALIAWLGAASGLVFGAIICWLQDTVGLVGMGMESSIVSNYPIKMQLTDFLYTGLVVVAVTLLTSYYPARLAAKSYSIRHL